MIGVPSYPCHHPTCGAYVGRRGGYCPDHEAKGQEARRERDRFYDRHARDPAARAFYNSAAWQRARTAKLAESPVCERCQRTWARHVHHRKPLARCSPAERTARENLMSVCPPCHNAIEKELLA